MTDELKRKILKEVVCLRSKLYRIDYVRDQAGTNAKGIQKCVQKTMHHNIFKECLLSQSTVQRETIQLKSASHQVVFQLCQKS